MLFLFKLVLEVANARRNEDAPREEKKLSPFAYNITIFAENLKDTVKQILLEIQASPAKSQDKDQQTIIKRNTNHIPAKGLISGIQRTPNTQQQKTPNKLIQKQAKDTK